MTVKTQKQWAADMRELNEEIRKLNQIIATKDKTLEVKDATIIDLDARINDLKGKVNELERFESMALQKVQELESQLQPGPIVLTDKPGPFDFTWAKLTSQVEHSPKDTIVKILEWQATNALIVIVKTGKVLLVHRSTLEIIVPDVCKITEIDPLII